MFERLFEQIVGSERSPAFTIRQWECTKLLKIGTVGGVNWLAFPETRHNAFLSTVACYKRKDVKFGKPASGKRKDVGPEAYLRLWESPWVYESAVDLGLLKPFAKDRSRETTRNPSGLMQNFKVTYVAPPVS